MRTVPRRSTLALLAAVAAAFAAPAVATAAEGQIIVKYAPGADARDRADARDDADVVRSAALPLAQTELVTPERGTSVREAVADLERSADVAYAEPDRPRSAFDDDTPPSTTPETPPTEEPPPAEEPPTPPAPTTANDPGFADQWALENTGMQRIWSGTFWYIGIAGDDINVRPAWDLAGTEATPTVAVIDSGDGPRAPRPEGQHRLGRQGLRRRRRRPRPTRTATAPTSPARSARSATTAPA